MKSELKLFAPKEYWELDPDVKQLITNGCGPWGWKGRLVPDHLWFLSIKLACDIHDFMYLVGETIEEKIVADRVFLNNMLRLIDHAGGFNFIIKKRKFLAKFYYEMVDNFGGPSFWESKNKLEEFRKVNLVVI